MPANDLPLSPVDQFVSDAARVDQARASTGQPAALDPNLVRSFEKAADQFGVPVDALLAIAEKDSGFDPLARSRGPGPRTRGIISLSDKDMARTGINPYVPEQAIGAAALKLRRFIDSGMSIEDAIKAHVAGPDKSTWGPQAQEYLDDVSARAKRLADTLYPTQPVNLDEPAQAPEPTKPAGVLGTLNDMRVALDQGFEAMIADIDGVARKVLPAKVMGAIDDIDRKLTGGKTQPELYEENRKRLDAEYSAQMKESLQRKWWDQEKGKFGDAFGDWRTYAGAILQSLPESVISSGPALKLAKGAYAAAILRGAAPAAAAKTAATVATVAGAVTEGALGGAQSEREVKEEIEKIPMETLRESDAFKSMVEQGMSEDAAKHALVHDLGTRAFITGGIATGLFGGMGDRIIAKTFLGKEVAAGVAGKIKNAALASAVNKGKQLGAAALGEGLAEELPQSALQQVAQNEAVKRADSKKDLMDDVINQAVGGAVTGIVMGAGMGGVFDHATRKEPPAPPPPASPPPSSPGAPSPEATEAATGTANPTAAAPETAAGPTAAAPEPSNETPAPSGPLSRALEAGAPHLSEAAKPAGGAVEVTDELGKRIGHIVAQDADGITFRDASGQVEIFSPEDISSGTVKIAQINEAAPAPAAPVEPSSTPPAEPVAARAEEPAEKPKKKEKAKKESSTGLTEAGGDMAEGMLGGMYDMLWKKVEAGDINENGKPSALLQAAKRVRDRGGLQTVDDLKALAQDYGKIESGPSYQSDMRALVEKHSPTPAAAETKADAAATEQPVSEKATEHVKRLPPEQPRTITDLSEPELRQKLKDLAAQAKAAGGWNKRFIEKRREIEAAIAGVKAKAKAGGAVEAEPISPEDGAAWWSSLSFAERNKAVKDSGYAVGGPGIPWENMTEPQRAKLLAARAPASGGQSGPGMQKFPKESGTLGIPRDEMPQVPAESHGGLVRHLNAQGIDHETKMVDAAELKPTQAEFSPEKVEAAKEAEGDRAVIVSNDGHIIDGHHQALAAKEEGEPVKAIVLDAPVKEALEAVKNSPSAQKEAEPAIERKPTPKSTWEHASAAVRDAKAVERGEVPVEDDRERQRRENVRKLEEQEPAPTAEATKDVAKDAAVEIGEKPRRDGKGRRLIGQNEAGASIWEDERGVRSIVQDGVRSTETVRLAPQQDGSTSISVNREGSSEYLTRDERVKMADAALMDAQAKVAEAPKSEPSGIDKALAALEADKAEFAAEEAAKKDASGPEKSAYGAGNKLVSADRAAELRERLKKKLRDAGVTMNSGIDPETLVIGAELAVFHIEAGTRAFADFARAMASDLGASIAALRPYLRGWYNGARDMMEDHGHDIAGLDSSDKVRSEIARIVAEQEKIDAKPDVAETSAKEKEAQDGRAAIHEDGAGPLEEVAPADDKGTPRGGDAERPSAASEQPGSGAGGEPDAARPSKARGRGNRAARTDNAASGKERSVKAATERGQEIADRAKEEPSLFEQSPSIEERETAPINIPDTNFVLTDDMRIGKGTEGEKFADNLAAIRALKQIEDEGRRATADEKAVLARYVGWGGLKNAFRVAGSAEGEGIAKGWESRVADLEGLLTPAELRAARNSTGAAHYTSPTVVKAMWRAVERLGFAGGAVLEPSVGTGNFLGFMPESARGKSDVFAVEYDSLTARMAQALYPNMDVVHSGFQDVPLPQNQFALAIGNPPFGADKLHFRFNPAANGKTIHNQFFIASLDGVREGGLMSMVVSHNLMDALDPSSRHDLAKQGKFMGAIRLPDTAFKENARTEVVTDILFFQKRTAAEQKIAADVVSHIRGADVSAETRVSDRFKEAQAEIASWTNSSKIADPAGSGEQINANAYFLENPHMVVGKIDASGTMNRRAELNVRLENPAEFEDRLNKAIDRLPKIDPRNEVAESSRVYYKTMAEGMKLAVKRAEPGAVRQTADGGLKTVVDMDAGEGSAKSILREIDLNENTPFNPDYTMNLDGKWQRTIDVKDDAGKPVKVTNAEGKATNRNVKQIVTYENEADIPARDRWGAERIAALRGMIPIRNLVKRQLQLEMQDATPKMIDENRERLNAAYDRFAKDHGELHSRDNAKIALTMPDGGLIMAVEEQTEKEGVKKAAIMSHRVTEPPKPAEHAKDASDAVAISLAEGGRIDLARVASLLNTDETGAIKALSEGEEPRAFYDPESANWEPSDLYLSGLVRKKLLAAREAGLEANIKALEKVVPADWDSSQIVPNIGSPWIPGAVYADFLKSLGYGKSSVHYSAVTNSFTVGYDGNPAPQWATSGRALPTGEIISRLLNSQPMKVTYRDNEGKTHVDEDASTESQLKANELFNEFLDWAYQDDGRREQLVRIFNDKFNTRLVRQRDGSHLTLPGKVPDAVIRMRRHQNNAIWRGITDRAVLYDHVVGAGKTFTAIARIMERKRMGLSRKAMVVVPNHLVEQWEKDATTLYPGAKVLAAGADDFSRANRRRLFGRIAAGDFDMTIIGHSSFGFIDLDPATEERYLMEELRSAQAAVVEADEAAKEDGYSGWGKPMGVREAERLVTKLETRLSRLRDAKRDRLLTFEEMGIDDLTIDEAHEFKNLAYSSRLSGVAGMGNKVGSQKATDLHMKVRSLHDRAGTAMAFLTGTPISNSVAEMYLVLRNLAPNEMKEMGIDNFDAWRSMYVSYAEAYEPTEAGGVKAVTRLGREWMNMKSLMDLYYSVADAVTTEDIQKAYAEDNNGKEFPIPKIASKVAGKGDREMVTIKPTPEQRSVLADIVAGFNNLPQISDIKARNIARLQLMDKARKISLDPRAVDPRAEVRSEGGKISAIVDRVSKIYRKSDADKGTQIVFLDRSVPKSKGDDKKIAAYDAARIKLREAMESGDDTAERKAVEALEKFDANEIESLRAAQAGGWNAYDEIKKQLVAKGIPANEIRFVQEANNDDQKAALFKQVKNGDVRVLIGSTPRMGAGTNVQDRLVALHHGDVTWKPSDIEQREGRIVRQGNKLLEKYGPDFAVDVIAYATEMTVDAKMWALNATKLRSINGIRKYDGSFHMEFEDQESASMAEMAALATGNPLMVERVTLNGDIQKLEIQQRSFNRRQNAMRDRLNYAKRAVETAPAKIAEYSAFADKLETDAKGVNERADARSITVQGKQFSSPDEAMMAADEAVKAIRGDEERARFSIEVGGEKITSMDAIEKTIRTAFGTYQFEATVDGKTVISAQDAAAAVMEKVKAKGNGSEYTLEGITLNGAPVEIDVSPFKLAARSDDKEVTFSALNDAGKQMAGYRTIVSAGLLSTAGVRVGLEKLFEKLNPNDFRQSARVMERNAAESGKEIPGLEKEIEKTWPQADQLKEKRDRLKEVTETLSKTSDADRLAKGSDTVQQAKAPPPSGSKEEARLRYLAKNPDEVIRLRDGIHRIIQSVLPAGAVRTEVRPRLEPMHDAAMELSGGESGTRPYGLFASDGINRIIKVALESRDTVNTAFHEAWHAVQELGLATKRELAVMRSPAEVRRLKKIATDAGYSGATMSQTEIEANFMGAYNSAMLAGVAPPRAHASTMAVADRFYRMLRRIRNFLAGHGFQTVEDIADRFRSGEMASRPFWNWTEDRIRSNEASAQAQAAPTAAPADKKSLFTQASNRASDFLTSVMVGTKGSSDSVGKFSGLALVPTRPLFMELTRGMQSARDYLSTKQAMDAMRNHWFQVAHDTIDRWQKFAVKNREENRALMDLMHESTLAQVDPSKAFESFLTKQDNLILANHKAKPEDAESAMRAKAEDDARRKAYGDMQSRYNAMSSEAKRLYNEVRDAYKTMADEGEKQVVANLQKALDHMVKQAEQTHADELRRIADEGLTGKEKDDAIAAADNRLATVKTRQRRQRAARIKSMRAEFETNRLKGPYFPLSRFGNYYVTVRNAAGEVQSFSRFESRREQRLFADDMRKEGHDVEEGTASAKSGLERNIDPKFVGEVEAILDGAGAPEGVRDAIWQRYLESLPDFSIRKHRIHRKGRAGFNTDAMRAFAHNMFHGSHQLARLTYGQDLQEHIDESRRQARDADDPVRAQAVVNEMVIRHDFIMNPKAAPWSHALSSFAFVWTMGANISSAIVNLDQAVTKGIPYLAYDAKTKAGMAKATAETLRAMRDFTVGKGTVESANLTADEKAAVRVGYDSGLIDRTQAHDVAGVAETGVEYSPWRNRIMRILAWPMHQTERFNREVTYLAGYRIARDAGLSHQEAIAKAADLTWMTHFDNQSTSKPRFMQGDVGRVAFALKGFQANLLYRLFRDLHQSMQGESPEDRKAALGRFASSIALTGAAAGIKGTAFYSILMILAGAAMGLAGSEDDPEEALRKWVLDHVGDSMIGQAVGGMLMDGVPGYLTGTSLSGRLGMSDLWFRSNDRDMNSEQTWNYWLEQLGGAPLSLGHQVWKGGSEIAKGNIVRGIEQMLPAALKNPAKAARYATEGVKDKLGDTVINKVPVQDVIKQAIGFTPAEIADRYARNTFQNNTQNRIKSDRQAAMRDAARAWDADDMKGYDKAMKKVDDFNDRHPEYEIKQKNIRQSMKSMEARSDRKEFGVDLQKSIAPYIKERTAPSIYSRH